MVRLSRRTILLAGSAWAFAGVGECNVSTQTTARPSLPIPPELRADAAGSIKLEAQTGTMRFLGDRETETYGVNGPYLGPALRLRRGETVTMQVTNNVPENITMHWHGLIIPEQPTEDHIRSSRRENGGRPSSRSISRRRRSGFILTTIHRPHRKSSKVWRAC